MMTRPVHRSARRRWFGVCTAGMVAGLIGTFGVGTANAAPVKVDYTFTGSSHIAKNNSDIALGPGELNAKLDIASGNFTGEFSLPKTHTSFKAFGLIPTEADVEIVAVKPVSGKLVSGVANATLTTDFKLSNVTVAGIKVDVGTECKGTEPTVIDLKSKPGFDPLKGGELGGSFVLNQFADCGVLTPLINQLVSGPDNTVTIELARKN